jgi:hypothetical protein
MKVTLWQNEVDALFLQDPNTAPDGGFQALLVRLQRNFDRGTSEIDLSDDDLQRIPKYAFDYKNGGWNSRLVTIFGRTLGPKLGR